MSTDPPGNYHNLNFFRKTLVYSPSHPQFILLLIHSLLFFSSTVSVAVYRQISIHFATHIAPFCLCAKTTVRAQVAPSSDLFQTAIVYTRTKQHQRFITLPLYHIIPFLTYSVAFFFLFNILDRSLIHTPFDTTPIRTHITLFITFSLPQHNALFIYHFHYHITPSISFSLTQFSLSHFFVHYIAPFITPALRVRAIPWTNTIDR